MFRENFEPMVTSSKYKAGCLGKEKFDLYSEADRVAKKVRRNTARNVPLAAYKCKFCGKFHIGRRTKKNG